MTVLLTRPQGRNELLAQQLKQHHIDVCITPLITISPLDKQGDMLDAQWADCVIFISQYAVKYGYLPETAWSEQTVFYAIGEATANALKAQNINAQIPTSHFTSEGLLELLSQQNIEHMHFLIIRGRGGREYLANELIKMGAHTKYLEVYERLPPKLNLDETISLWKKNKLSTIVITSDMSLDFFEKVLKNNHATWLKELKFIVPSARLEAKANKLGLHHTVNADGADDASMLHAITNIELFSS